MLKTLLHMRSIYVMAIFVMASGVVWAQNPGSPAIDCIVVDPDGTVELQWTTPADPAGIGVEYRLFEVDIAAGTETLVQTIPFNETTHIVAGLNGNAAFSCFYLQTTFNNGSLQTAPAGPTACSSRLTANAAVVPGIVQINWNNPIPGDPSPVPGTVQLLMEYPAGTWSVLAEFPHSLGVTTYSYEVDICEAILNFRISYAKPGGCTFLSSIDGGFFQDQIDPTAPEIYSVSVDSLSHEATLFWNPSPQNDVSGYIIYQCIPGFNPIPLDTIFGTNILQWSNPDSEANMGVEFYNIAAFDSCLMADGAPDPGAASPSCYSSMHLTHQWIPCTDFVSLSWTAYDGWDDGVAQYQIFAAEEPIPGSGVFLPSFAVGMVDGNTTTFMHEDANLGSSYRYRVRAVANSGGYTASSNRRTATLFYPNSPAYTYLREATVIDLNTVEITVELGPGGVTNHMYILERKRSNSDEFDTRDAIEFAGQGELVFTDDVTNTSERSYTYRVSVFNECGDEVEVSNIGKTIVLSGFTDKEELLNILTWTSYEQWSNGVLNYELYRTVDQEGAPELLNTLPTSQRDDIDDFSDLLGASQGQSPLIKGEFCYYVVAVENGNGFSQPGRSKSNTICLTQEPIIWVPNAFLINGFNNIFRPVISFADFDNYRLQIYSRWGDMIFETNDILEGWDGNYRDRLVPEGVYAWFVSISDGAGRIYEKRGTVVMMVGEEN